MTGQVRQTRRRRSSVAVSQNQYAPTYVLAVRDSERPTDEAFRLRRARLIAAKPLPITGRSYEPIDSAWLIIPGIGQTRYGITISQRASLSVKTFSSPNFRDRVRTSGFSVAYSLATAKFSGFTPAQSLVSGGCLRPLVACRWVRLLVWFDYDWGLELKSPVRSENRAHCHRPITRFRKHNSIDMPFSSGVFCSNARRWFAARSRIGERQHHFPRFKRVKIIVQKTNCCTSGSDATRLDRDVCHALLGMDVLEGGIRGDSANGRVVMTVAGRWQCA